MALGSCLYFVFGGIGCRLRMAGFFCNLSSRWHLTDEGCSSALCARGYVCRGALLQPDVRCRRVFRIWPRIAPMPRIGEVQSGLRNRPGCLHLDLTVRRTAMNLLLWVRRMKAYRAFDREFGAFRRHGLIHPGLYRMIRRAVCESREVSLRSTHH
jgi:hypothetical protein